MHMKEKFEISKTALLVVDVVNSCCHEKCEIKKWGVTFKKIRKMVPRLEKFISKYREMGGQAIFIKCLPWTKKFLPANINELYKNPKCAYYSTDKTGFSEKLFKLTPEKSDFVFYKNSYDAFTNPKLDEFLKKRKINHLLVSGVFGDGCVNATIQGGFSAGYNFIILKDLIETTDDKTRQKIQKLLKQYTWPTMYGKTINSKELLQTIK